MRFQYKAGGATAQAHFCHIFGKISDRASGTGRTRTRSILSAEGGRFAGGDKTSRASPGNARALSYIAGKFLARFVFKKGFFILSCLWKWLDSAFQTCLPLSKIQRDARRAHRPPRFRAILRADPRPGPPPWGPASAGAAAPAKFKIAHYGHFPAP